MQPSVLQPPESFAARDVQTTTFTLHTEQKLTDPTAAVKIYIEGDGHAFDHLGRPTDDPTPRSDFMRRAAFGDASPNVVYMGRPCQYVHDTHCTPADWTSARFSKRAVDATADAIAQIANGLPPEAGRCSGRPTILIGFSGGAQIAGLVAVLHPELNVKKIITISGNLDHPAWTRLKNLAPLDGSLDLNSYRAAFARIPQLHYVGDADPVIPADLTIRFVNDPSRIVIVPSAGHGTGFDAVFSQIWAE